MTSQRGVANDDYGRDNEVSDDDVLSLKIVLQRCNFLQTPVTDGGAVDGDPVLDAGGGYCAGDYAGGFQRASL